MARSHVNARSWIGGRRFRSLFSTWVSCDSPTCFDYVSDCSRHGEWTNDEVRILPVQPGPVGLGKRYNAIAIQRGKQWPAELVVTAFEPPSAFEFTATGGPIPAPQDDPYRHRFTFTPEPGGTQIVLERWDPMAPGWPKWFGYLLFLALVPLATPIRKKTLVNLQRRLEEVKTGTPTDQAN